MTAVYVYPDGRVNLVFRGGLNIPTEGAFQSVEISAQVLRRAQREARRGAARNAA